MIDNEISKEITVSYGVPEGTVLGTIWFILYVSYVFNLPVSAEITSFAGDSVFFFKDKNWNILKYKIINSFPIIIKYFDWQITSSKLGKNYFCTVHQLRK